MTSSSTHLTLCMGIVSLALGLGIVQKKTPAKPSETDKRQFTLFAGQKEGKPLLALMASDLKAYPFKAKFPWFLHLSVPFINPTDDGFPNPKDNEALSGWEDEMETKIAEQVKSLYVGHVTWDGSREVLFYLEKCEPILSQLQKMKDSHSVRPFTFVCERDESWKKISTYLQ